MFIFLVGAADVIVFLLFPLVVCLLLCPFALRLALSASPNEAHFDMVRELYRTKLISTWFVSLAERSSFRQAHFDKLNELNNPVVMVFGGSPLVANV